MHHGKQTTQETARVHHGRVRISKGLANGGVAMIRRGGMDLDYEIIGIYGLLSEQTDSVRKFKCISNAYSVMRAQ